MSFAKNNNMQAKLIKNGKRVDFLMKVDEDGNIINEEELSKMLQELDKENQRKEQQELGKKVK